MAKTLQELPSLTGTSNDAYMLVKQRDALGNVTGDLDYRITVQNFLKDVVPSSRLGNGVGQIPVITTDSLNRPALPAISGENLTNLTLPFGDTTTTGLVRLSDSLTLNSNASNRIAATPRAVNQLNLLKANLAGSNTFAGNNTFTAGFTISSSTPQIAIRDTNGVGASHSGFISFRDSSNVQRGWIGFGSTANTRLSISNNYDPINGVTIHDNPIYHAGNSNLSTVDWSMNNSSVSGNLSVAGESTFSGDIHLRNNTIDFKTNGSSTVPQFLGHRSSEDLDNRFLNTEGGWSYTTFNLSTPNSPSQGAVNNANGLLTFNKHTGSFNHQIALMGDGSIYQRARGAGVIGTSWKRFVMFGDNIGTGTTQYAAGNHNHNGVYGGLGSSNTWTGINTWSGGSAFTGNRLRVGGNPTSQPSSSIVSDLTGYLELVNEKGESFPSSSAIVMHHTQVSTSKFEYTNTDAHTGFFNVDSDDSNFQGIKVAGNTVWHAGNDGSGSGLDADLLDGLHASSFGRLSRDQVWTGSNTFSSKLMANVGSTISMGSFGREDESKFYVNFPSGTGSWARSVSWDNIANTTMERFRIGVLGKNHDIYRYAWLGFGGHASDNSIRITPQGVLSVGDNLVWHQGNDGSGSGLDADTLDGFHASSLGRLSSNNIWTGSNEFNSTGDAQLSVNAGVNNDATFNLSEANKGLGFGILYKGSTTNRTEFYTRQNNTNYNFMTVNRASTSVSFVGTPTVAGNTIWHAGNDGSGSGLDADLLDGLQGTAYARASHTHPINDINGLQTVLNNKLNTSLYTASDVLSKIRTVDGSGSGLDADTLDGLHASSLQDTLSTVTARNRRTSTAGSAVWSETTQGRNLGNIHIETINTDHAGGSITFDASDTTGSQAGIYVKSDVSYGTRMYLSTTDSYASGSKTAMSLSERGDVVIPRGSLLTSGNITAFSDKRVKKDIKKIDNSLSKVNKLSGYTFERTDMDCPRQTGVIAQEVLEVLPEAVSENEEGQLSVAYGNMVGLLIESVKELTEKVTSLEKQVEELSK